MDANSLGRWTRFAAKGGIGRCTALTDCVAEKPEDLMFLTDDEIIVLMQVTDAEDMYLGYCEGVVGRFSGSNVRFHAKLKKPVMTKRSSTTAKSPTPSTPTSVAGRASSPRSTPSSVAAAMTSRTTSPSIISSPSPSHFGHMSSPPSIYSHMEEIHDTNLTSSSPSSRLSSPRSSVQRPIDSFPSPPTTHTHPYPPPSSSSSLLHFESTQPLKLSKPYTASPLAPSHRPLSSPSPPPISPTVTTTDSSHGHGSFLSSQSEAHSNAGHSDSTLGPGEASTSSVALGQLQSHSSTLYNTSLQGSSSLFRSDSNKRSSASSLLYGSRASSASSSYSERRDSPRPLSTASEGDGDGETGIGLTLLQGMMGGEGDDDDDDDRSSTHSRYSTQSGNKSQLLSHSRTDSPQSMTEPSLVVSTQQPHASNGRKSTDRSQSSTLEGTSPSPSTTSFTKPIRPPPYPHPHYDGSSSSVIRSPISPTESTGKKSFADSLRPSESSASDWDGASDIYDDYRYSRYSMYSKRASQFSTMTTHSVGMPSIAGGGGSSPFQVPPVPRGRADSTQSSMRSEGGAVGSEVQGMKTGAIGMTRRPSADSEASIYTQQSGHQQQNQQHAPHDLHQDHSTRMSSMTTTTNTTTKGPPAPLDLSRSSALSSSSFYPQSATSPLLHTTWASPEASPETSVRHISATSSLSAGMPSPPDRERAPQGSLLVAGGSGFGIGSSSGGTLGGGNGAASALRQRLELDTKPEDSTPENRLQRKQGSQDDYFGRGGPIVVEDDDEDVPVINPIDPPSPSASPTSPTSSSHATLTHTPHNQAQTQSSTLLSSDPIPPPPPSPSQMTDSPTTSSFARPRPTLNDLRGERVPGTGMRRSLFMPHPNAPKAPPVWEVSQGPMYIRSNASGNNKQEVSSSSGVVVGAGMEGSAGGGLGQATPGSPAFVHPRAQGGWAPDIMRVVLQRQAQAQGGPGGMNGLPGGGMRAGPGPAGGFPKTFYATADLSQSTGPVPIFFSLEPPQGVPALMRAAAAAAAAAASAGSNATTNVGLGIGVSPSSPPPSSSPVPSPLSISPPTSHVFAKPPPSPLAASSSASPESDRHHTNDTNLPSPSMASPIPRKAATIPVVPKPRTTSIHAGVHNMKLPERKGSTSPEIHRSRSKESEPATSPTGTESDAPPSPSATTTGGTLPRANFFPQVGGSRPRSRSFSGFDRPSAETELPVRSASPSSKPTITQPVDINQPSTAIPIRAASPQRTLGGRQAPKLPIARGPSPLSRPQNIVVPHPGSVMSPPKSPSSPLSREAPIAAPSHQPPSSESNTSQSGPRPHPLRHVTSVGKMEQTSPPPSPASPVANKPRVLRKAPSTNTDMIGSGRTSTQSSSGKGPVSPENEFPPAIPRHMSSSQQSAASSTPRSSTESIGRSSLASPPPGTSSSNPRNHSLKSKMSLPNLRRPSGSKSTEEPSPTFAIQSPVEVKAETVQFEDMDFELVRPTIPASLRNSEDSLARGRVSSEGSASGGAGGGSSSLFLRTDSPAVSLGSNPPRSPTVASSRAQEADAPGIEAHRQREQRWISLMGSSPASAARKSKKVKKLVLEGVPASVRSLVWAYLTDCKAKGVPGVYEKMAARGKTSNAWGVVDRDIERLVKERSELANVSVALGTVLKAFLEMAPDVKYDIGLPLVVGHLLLVIPEENSFWVFVSMMDFLLRPYFSTVTTQLEVDCELFGRAFEANDAQLAKKVLVDLGISTMDLCRPWFSSCFASALPPETLSRSWDLFLYEGQPYLIRMGLAIAFCCRTKVLSDSTTNAETTLAYMHHPSPTWFPPSVEGFITLAASFKLRDDEIAKQRVKMEHQVKKQVQAAQLAASRASNAGRGR